MKKIDKTQQPAFLTHLAKLALVVRAGIALAGDIGLLELARLRFPGDMLRVMRAGAALANILLGALLRLGILRVFLLCLLCLLLSCDLRHLSYFLLMFQKS